MISWADIHDYMPMCRGDKISFAALMNFDALLHLHVLSTPGMDIYVPENKWLYVYISQTYAVRAKYHSWAVLGHMIYWLIFGFKKWQEDDV